MTKKERHQAFVVWFYVHFSSRRTELLSTVVVPSLIILTSSRFLEFDILLDSPSTYTALALVDSLDFAEKGRPYPKFAGNLLTVIPFH